MLSEMEDTLAEGFRGHRQLPYAHWITFLLRKAVTHKSPETMAEWTCATTEFPQYDMSQMLCHSHARTPRQLSRHPDIPEIVAQ